MSLLKVKGRQTTAIGRESEGNNVYVKGLRDGTLTMAGFVEAMCLEGRVFHVTHGTVTAEATFGAGSLLETEPDLQVLAPAGTTIIPIGVTIQIEAYGSTAIFEAMVSIGGGGAAGADTPLTPVNLHTGSSRTSECDVGGSTNSGAATDFTTNRTELVRWGFAKAVTIGTATDDSAWYPPNYHWSAAKAGYYPIIKGAGGFMVYAAGQASTGFISARWVEVPSEYFN
ncbi:hypothetical protein LCGC14_0983630 [marine sediment metagenome]|uniref:Uncharacterized protein n=1 Tax=marine sediment metagenome TaxID=412755 RepID=A0A0F9QR82_9ZZZZ